MMMMMLYSTSVVCLFHAMGLLIESISEQSCGARQIIVNAVHNLQ